MIDYLGTAVSCSRRHASCCSPASAARPTRGARRRSSLSVWPARCWSASSPSSSGAPSSRSCRSTCSRSGRSRSPASSASSSASPCSARSRLPAGLLPDRPRRVADDLRSSAAAAPRRAGHLLDRFGSIISRTGRYRVFPIVGTGLMTIGLLLLSRMGIGTSSSLAALYMLVLGIGLGCVMQVLVLIVQNAVPYSELGVATSGATFFRSIGGSFGTAIFGAIFSNVLVGNLVRHLGTAKLPAGLSSASVTPGHLRPASRRPSITALRRPMRSRSRPCSSSRRRSLSSRSSRRGSSRSSSCEKLSPPLRRKLRAFRARNRAREGGSRAVLCRHHAKPWRQRCTVRGPLLPPDPSGSGASLRLAGPGQG